MRTFSLTLLTLLSAQALAVENGTSLDWSLQDNAVRFDSRQTGRQGLCTGTILAGRYVITAAHCLDESELDSFTTASSDNYLSTNFVTHPNHHYDGSFSSEDIGIVKADSQVDYKNIQFLNIDNHTENEAITIAGFGGTVETLNQADFTFSHYYPNPDDPDRPFAVYADMVNDSHTQGGDSGSAWVNESNEVMAIHKGSSTYVDWDDEGNEIRYRKTYGTDIKAVQDFILQNIDAWHYPTLVDANGRTTITVQSLHYNGVTEQAYTEGDATLITDESTCITRDSPIKPFEKCTYVIESNGAEGALYLSADEVIQINKPTENSGGGDGSYHSDDSSGGSMGAWSFLLLGLGALRRKR